MLGSAGCGSWGAGTRRRLRGAGWGPRGRGQGRSAAPVTGRLAARARVAGPTGAFPAEAVESGFEAIALTVDAPVPGRRERDLRTAFSVPPELVPSLAATGSDRPASVAEVLRLVDPALSWNDLESLVGSCSLPVLVKGVLTPEGARLPVEHGAAGGTGSNHGGRHAAGRAVR